MKVAGVRQINKTGSCLFTQDVLDEIDPERWDLVTL
jgi:hypothetical protein